MSYINNMYGQATNTISAGSDKNPNRVSGGLRAQGSDRMIMFTEDGVERELPTLNYVRTLEEKVKKQQEEMRMLERKSRKTEQALTQLTSVVQQMRK